MVGGDRVWGNHRRFVSLAVLSRLVLLGKGLISLYLFLSLFFQKIYLFIFRGRGR